MAGGENEAITVEPVGILGIVAHDLVVEDVAQGGTSHGKARMAGVGLLDGVDGQEPDRVDGLVHQGLRGGLPLQCLHRRRPGDGGAAGPGGGLLPDVLEAGGLEGVAGEGAKAEGEAVRVSRRWGGVAGDGTADECLGGGHGGGSGHGSFSLVFAESSIALG